MVAQFAHVPVLSAEVVEGLAVQAGGHYLDATVGGGGHSRLILQAAPSVKVTAIDRDEVALAAARAELAEFGDAVEFWQGNFAEYDPGEKRFDGAIADLGVSSAQLDVPDRGFSFRQEAPLDMRMDRAQDLTAAEIVNHWDEAELADIFYRYGEERYSRGIARKIVQQRPFQTTTDLAYAIGGSVPRRYRYGRIHPATRVFQALRIAVNAELSSLESFLEKAPGWLKPGGRLVAISFHSLEDRLVKHQLRGEERFTVVTKKPIVAKEAEIASNPRARSAKLRVAERLSGAG
ncbi:16S rRNA (cytosine(1402)-N(4))-methyltransferase RsmH [Phormidium sp. CCY1219]|uniref:16S rRNA (cytosine(1402)-N(4))-methyltransferase RsmH n=1 Tax=Phormidium sp. CCY1219 TaxID=2886104 RepID=UPI002D1E8FF2|nr:16S rRNA (cytosine(1402)-N(4))-methyltransferase RsmH [Phormidium sp. CCY1219]MEB3830308.1 16S rRNA (cytosine(1402)-N(4))-methyltransferase RsmH [Phormidium sp. CCY1219]